jgi:hypothetical protein
MRIGALDHEHLEIQLSVAGLLEPSDPSWTRPILSV